MTSKTECSQRDLDSSLREFFARNRPSSSCLVKFDDNWPLTKSGASLGNATTLMSLTTPTLSSFRTENVNRSNDKHHAITIDVKIIDHASSRAKRSKVIIKVCSAVIVMQPQLFIVIARDPTNVE